MLFSNKEQKLDKHLILSRAKKIYFMNYGNYGNMKRNGEYEDYMKYGVSKTLEDEWSSMIIKDLSKRIKSGEEVWRVVNLANIRASETEIMKCFQELSNAPNAHEILAAIEKAEVLISPCLFHKIKNVMITYNQARDRT